MRRLARRVGTARGNVEVFALATDAAQIVWADLPAGPVQLHAGPAAVPVHLDHPGGPGGIEISGLPAGAAVTIAVRSRGRVVHRERVRTLAPPPGAHLARFATLNDIHIGDPRFGLVVKVREEPDRPPSAERCLAGALDAAVAWGAARIVVKGDLTWQSRAHEFRRAGALLGATPVPVDAILGNHDVRRWGVDGPALLRAGGVAVHEAPAAVDLPGLRLVLVPTATSPEGGRIPREVREAAVDLAAGGPAAWIGVHHYLQRFPFPVTYPMGVPSPDGDALLADLAAAQPRTLLSSGHTHRNRRRDRGPVVMTQVSSTKDFPGVWAGYDVYEGGIVQVVRRIVDPPALAWLERTRLALFGAWPLWSQGLRSHRCFSHPWPT